jgi:hypothetical protein
MTGECGWHHALANYQFSDPGGPRRPRRDRLRTNAFGTCTLCVILLE